MAIEKFNKKEDTAHNVRPHIIQNRFDKIYPNNYEIMELVQNGEVFYIPIHIEKHTAFIGIYLSPLDYRSVEKITDTIFANYKNVKKIKIESTPNAPPKNSLLTMHRECLIRLPKAKEDYLKGLSSKVRYNSKWYYKKIEKELGKIEIKHFTADKAPEEYFQKYFEFKYKTHVKDYAMTKNQYIEKYFVTDLYVLFVNNRVGAILLNSETGENIYLENFSYDTNYSKYSLGSVILTQMILASIEKKKKKIFLGQYQEYKKHYSTDVIEVYSGYIYKNFSQVLLKRFNQSFLKITNNQTHKTISLMGMKIVIHKDFRNSFFNFWKKVLNLQKHS